jgi:GNAT superfamily N-acetyltransferase
VADHARPQVLSVELQIVTGRADESPGADLIEAELRDLAMRYGAEDEPDGLAPSQMAPPEGIFFIAWRDGVAVGCGGLRRSQEFDGAGEIKRMYVTDEARRTGVGRAVLSALESEAARLGYDRLVLETGTAQPEAIGLYASAGYELVEPFGIYRDSPLSRCYAKVLDGSSR